MARCQLETRKWKTKVTPELVSHEAWKICEGLKGLRVPDISFTGLHSERQLSLFPGLSRFVSCSYDLAAKFPDYVVYRRIPAGRN